MRGGRFAIDSFARYSQAALSSLNGLLIHYCPNMPILINIQSMFALRSVIQHGFNMLVDSVSIVLAREEHDRWKLMKCTYRISSLSTLKIRNGSIKSLHNTTSFLNVILFFCLIIKRSDNCLCLYIILHGKLQIIIFFVNLITGIIF